MTPGGVVMLETMLDCDGKVASGAFAFDIGEVVR